MRERTRRRVLAAAREIVAEAGVDAITMRELGERAGVSVQSVYNLFGAKDRLVTALVEEELRRLDATFAAVDEDDSVQRLRAQQMLLVDSAISHTRPALALAVLSDTAGNERFFNTWRSHTLMEDGLRRAIADGLLRSDVSPAALAEHVRGALLHALRLWAAGLLNDAQLRRQAAFGLDVALLAIAEEPTRRRLLRRMRRRDRAGR